MLISVNKGAGAESGVLSITECHQPMRMILMMKMEGIEGRHGVIGRLGIIV